MATQTGGIRVLLVDDQRMVREGIRSLLESIESIDVVGEACNGAEAIACVGTLNPQVVVMDINMPKMDGLAATRLVSPSTKVPPGQPLAAPHRRIHRRLPDLAQGHLPARTNPQHRRQLVGGV